MKFKNIDIENASISFQKSNLDFSEYGVYLILGENGVGKSTLLESLIFDENEVEFNTKEQEELYKNDKASLFSYVPQICNIYESSILEYLTKGNSKIDLELLENYRKVFDIRDIDLKEKISKLSGGEKIKISIICALLKDTPYIFLDEPTNHMDEETVKNFIAIIRELSKERTFIIVSHDKRFQEKLNSYKIVKIEKNEIIQEIDKNKSKGINTYVGKGLQRSYKKFQKHINFNIINIIYLYIFAIVMVFLVTFNGTEFYKNYSDKKDVIKKDIILTYKAEYIYTTTNQVYAKAQKMDINSNKYNRYITYDDIETIAEIENVERIVLEDKEKLFQRFQKISEGEKEEINIFAIPQDAITEFEHYYGAYLSGFGNLKYGRYPYDEKKEICLSEEVLRKYFKINVSDIENAMGKEINYNGKKYQVVGILDNRYNMCMISFHSDEDYGFYEYDKDTWKTFIKKLDSNQGTESVLIYTKAGTEKQVLNEIFTLYPAENYNSKVFSDVWVKQYNRDFMIHNIYPVNFIMSIVLSMIMIIIKNRKIKLDKPVLNDYANYYFEKKRIQRIYRIGGIIQSCVPIIIAVLANTLYSDLAYVSNMILFVDGVIIFVPALMISLKKIV